MLAAACCRVPAARRLLLASQCCCRRVLPLPTADCSLLPGPGSSLSSPAGDQVWVKVVSKTGQRLGLAMRDVDQATGAFRGLFQQLLPAVASMH